MPLCAVTSTSVTNGAASSTAYAVAITAPPIAHNSSKARRLFGISVFVFACFRGGFLQEQLQLPPEVCVQRYQLTLLLPRVVVASELVIREREVESRRRISGPQAYRVREFGNRLIGAM